MFTAVTTSQILFSTNTKKEKKNPFYQTMFWTKHWEWEVHVPLHSGCIKHLGIFRNLSRMWLRQTRQFPSILTSFKIVETDIKVSGRFFVFFPRRCPFSYFWHLFSPSFFTKITSAVPPAWICQIPNRSSVCVSPLPTCFVFQSHTN